MIIIVARLAITHHSHDIRECHTGTVILIRIEENPQSFELIRRPKHGTLCSTLFGEPERESVAVQMARSVNLELNFDLSHQRRLLAVPPPHNRHK